jgi:hypothetical protein
MELRVFLGEEEEDEKSLKSSHVQHEQFPPWGTKKEKGTPFYSM